MDGPADTASRGGEVRHTPPPQSERFTIDKGGQRLPSLDRGRIRRRQASDLSSCFGLDNDVGSATSPLVPEFAFDGCREMDAGLGWGEDDHRRRARRMGGCCGSVCRRCWWRYDVPLHRACMLRDR